MRKLNQEASTAENALKTDRPAGSMPLKGEDHNFFQISQFKPLP